MPLRDADNFERSHSHNDDTGGSHMSTIAAAEGRGMFFKSINVDGLNIFYREAGSEAAPQLVLLHGFPASSHQYRNLIPALADRFHVIAPDYPGFGNSDMPDPAKFAYTFDRTSGRRDEADSENEREPDPPHGHLPGMVGGSLAELNYWRHARSRASHAGRCVACQGVGSQPVPVAPVGDCSIPVV